MAGRRDRAGWRGMVRALTEARGEDGAPCFARVAPGVLRRDERAWPAVVWVRTGGEVVAELEGESYRTTVLLSFLAPTFLEAETAREKGLAALEQANLLVAPPEPPYDEYEDELDDGEGASEDGGCFAVMQEVMLR